MSLPRKLLLAFAALFVIALLWFWWNRPQRAEMAEYAPADSLVYLEANSLADAASGIMRTEAWQELAPHAGLRTEFPLAGWLRRFVAWTGIGPADAVILARAQAAAVVLGFDAAEADAGETLNIRPRVALIIETHTSERRARAVVEQLVGDFARRAYGEPNITRREAADSVWTIWAAPAGNRRIVAAVSDSLVVISNDETAAQTCLAVRRGERSSLAGNAQLALMRERVRAGEALAFGYVPQAGAGRLFELAAVAYAGQLGDNPRAQSAAAILVPQLSARLAGSAAWSARLTNGRMEDRYFFALPEGVAPRLREALQADGAVARNAGDILPALTYQLTTYNYRDPEAAWRSLNAAVSSQLDTLSAPFAVRFLEEALKPYGVESPRDFLRATGPEITTARLDSASESALLVAVVRDREALRAQVRRRLGANHRTERIGDAELLIAANPEHGAASFVGPYLIMGSAEDARRCLVAHAAAQTLATTEVFQQAARETLNSEPPGVITYTDDRDPAGAFLRLFTAQNSNSPATNEAALAEALARRAYAVSATRLADGGFERATRSSFGQLGALAAQLAPARTTGEAR